MLIGERKPVWDERKKEAVESGMLLVDWVETELRNQVSHQRASQQTRMPQERDLARQMGVSLSTVRGAMARLREDSLIRSVQGRGTFIVPQEEKSKTGQVLVLPRHVKYLYQHVGANTLDRVLREKGYVPNVFPATDPEVIFEQVRSMDDLVGVIALAVEHEDFLRTLTQGIDVPVVCVGDIIHSPRAIPVCDQVTNSNAGVGYVAAEELIRKGHRDIMLLSSKNERVYTREFIFGVRQAFDDNGVPFNEEWCFDLADISQEEPSEDGPFSHSVESVHRKMDRLLTSDSSGAKPTALICPEWNELRIREVLHEYLHDLIAPENIVLVTYAEYLPISFTGRGSAVAVCSRVEDIARRAVGLLSVPREKDEPPRRELLQKIYVYERNNGEWSRRKNALLANGESGTVGL
jgi:DNA-binding LacI/PurR family transcriptional regulator